MGTSKRGEQSAQAATEALAAALQKSTKIVGFTGAGISTESGIADYRSQGGLWDRYQPVYFEEFLSDESQRLLYWQRKRDTWPSISRARPNAGHLFFRALDDQRKLLGLITQNVDGLHERSGIPKDRIVNLHGNTLETVCLSCGRMHSTGQVLADSDQAGPAPRCGECSGLLKPNTISFGQNLRQAELQRADSLCRECDFMIVAGSTLVVQPAAGIPALAKQNGAGLAIINLSATPLDALADHVLREQIGPFLERLRVLLK